MTRPTYTLASLALLTALIGVFLGVAVRSLAYGIVFLFLCLPALLRTILINERRKAQGQGLSFSEKILAFGASLVVVVMVAAASGGTLAGLVSLAIRPHGRSADVNYGLLIFAFVASGLVGLFLLRWLWRPRE